MTELSDRFFEESGFDVSNECGPFTKDCVDGTIVVYKNYVRDGSGRHDGYIVIRPQARVVKTFDEFMDRRQVEPSPTVWMTDAEARELNSDTIVVPKDWISHVNMFTHIVGDIVSLRATGCLLVEDMGDKVRLKEGKC